MERLAAYYAKDKKLVATTGILGAVSLLILQMNESICGGDVFDQCGNPLVVLKYPAFLGWVIFLILAVVVGVRLYKYMRTSSTS